MASNSSSHNKPFARQPKDKPNFLNRFLKLLNITAAILLLVWAILGNVIASQIEKPFLQAKAEMLERFPKIETNASAIKIENLSAKLGLPPSRKVKAGFYQISEVGSEEFKRSRKFLSTYLDEFFETNLSKKSDDLIDPPSKSIQSYLFNQSANIANLRNHLLTNPFPQWERASLNEVLNSSIIKSFSLVDTSYISGLNVILLTEALNNVRLGRDKIAIDTLEAQQNLNQFLFAIPDQIGILISMIQFRRQIKILRAVDRVPTEWRQRKVPDYFKYILITNQLEAIKYSEMLRNFPLTKGGIYGNVGSVPLLNRILQPFQQPYWTFAAIDIWNQKMQNINESFSRDICQDNPQISTNYYHFSWWNLPSNFASPISWSPPRRAYRVLLDWDLTQKIMNLREIAHQTGGFPKSLPKKGFSPICKNFRYVYQASPQGDKMTISLENIPAWLNEDKSGLPLTYTAHFKKT